MVAFDVDMAKLHAKGVVHAAIIYCTNQSTPTGTLIDGIALICECYEAGELIGKLEYL